MFLSSLAYLIPFTRYPYRGENVACNLCGSTDVEEICGYDRRFKRLRTVACIGCGLMRTDPMPTAAEVAKYYKDVYRWDYQFVTRKPSGRHLSRSRREAKHRLHYLMAALRPGARVLDFGCGAGQFLEMAAAGGYAVQGIEPGRDYANFARKNFGIEVISDMWEQITLPRGSFDVITAVEVLEHLRQPVEALRWLASLLADDGVIYLTVPNVTPITRETFRLFHFAHLHSFTPTTLQWTGAVCGLEPDPRFTPCGTMMALRKAAKAADPATFRGNHGASLSAKFPRASIARYVLSGAWIAGRWRQLQKTMGDTFSPPSCSS
jgi:2-polyprenyl-3-methyl-5-hydroxy-6-metoxy-1,4-benzoquinol methylase